jgi:outer membrane protein assembly factor BamB
MSLSRRATLLSGLALAGCSSLSGTLDDLFESDKPVAPGKREAVLAATRGLQVDPADHGAVMLPPPVRNADWLQSGGTPTHAVGNLEVGGFAKIWTHAIGAAGGYRSKITASPIVAGQSVFTMDSDGVVAAFDIGTGSRHWRTETQGDEDRSTNVGGGIAAADGVIYAATGRGEALALDAAKGVIKWRTGLDAPARSAPTVVEGKLFVATLDERMLALNTADGKRIWAYQATQSATVVLGEPAPAYADGLLVCGFGSGDLVALRADGGALAWSDSLASARGRNSLADLSAIRALPVIVGNVVYTVGVAGVLVATDLRSGRRLWEREVAGQYTPWVVGDWLFVLTMEQQLAAIRRVDGRVRWISNLPRYDNEKKQRDPIFWAGPLVAGKYIFLAGSTQKLLAINPGNGEILGQQDLPGPASIGPIAAQGKLFILTDDATLSALG